MNKTLSEKYKRFSSFTVGSHTYYFRPTWGKSIQFKDGSVIIKSNGGTVSYKVNALSDKVENWEREFDKRFNVENDNKYSNFRHEWDLDAGEVKNFIRNLLDTRDKQLYQSLEEMKDTTWIEHGRDCEEGLRPCGGVVDPEANADRCEFRQYDKTTINKAQQLLGGGNEA